MKYVFRMILVGQLREDEHIEIRNAFDVLNLEDLFGQRFLFSLEIYKIIPIESLIGFKDNFRICRSKMNSVQSDD